jgi:hypothetical protein
MLDRLYDRVSLIPACCKFSIFLTDEPDHNNEETLI